MTSLRILGPVEAWHGGQRLELGGLKQLKLFAYLVLNANQALMKETMIHGLRGSDRTYTGLPMAVSRLRTALEPLTRNGEPILRTVTGGYLFSVAPGELDADTFYASVHAGIRALENGDQRKAVDCVNSAFTLWRGPPLAEFAFDDFAIPEIRRLEELRLRALQCRIDAELALGRHADVIPELDKLWAEEATNQYFAGQLMRALDRSGRQAEALDVWHRTYAALDEEGLLPGAGLQSIQAEILDQSDSLRDRELSPESGGPPSETVPLPIRLRPYGPSVFADRRREREVLWRAFEGLRDAGRQAAFVTGEAGIGKTRLVCEFARKAHESGALVLAGRCDEGLATPYQPFVEALDHLVSHIAPDLLKRHIERYGDSIARLIPALSVRIEHRPAPSEPMDSERFVLFREIEELLAAVSRIQPVVIVLEDLHWADRPTAELLRWLVKAPRDWPLMLLCTCRIEGLDDQHPLRELLVEFHRERNALRLDLQGLESDDIVVLVQGIDEVPAGKADERLARTLELNTNGNPFFVTELVRDLADTGALIADAGKLRLKQDLDLTARLPVSISETLGQRLGGLGGEVRRDLGAAAAIGEEFDADLLSEVVGPETASSAIDRALAEAVLTEVPGAPGRYRFAHALMQRYLYNQVGAATQTEQHRLIALAIEGRERDDRSQVAELARHWAETVDADLDTALRYSTLAGDDALEKLAPDDARQWYGASLELLGRRQTASESARCELLIKRGQAERQSGDLSFRATLLEAAELAQRIGDDEMLVRAALGNTRGMQSETGVVDEGRMKTLDAALRIVGDGDRPERARLLAMQAAELMYSGEWERRVDLSNEALKIARRLNDVDALSTVLNMRFVTLLAPKTLAERRANTIEGVKAAERQSDPLVRFFAYHWRAYACVEVGDVLASRRWLAREREIAEQLRQPTAVWLSLADQANLAIIDGDLTLADRLAANALEVGKDSEPDAWACFAAQQTSIAFEDHRLGAFVPALEQAVADNPGVPGFRATLALALVEAGRFEDAGELLRTAVATEFRDLPYDVTWLAVVCIYAQVSSDLRDVEGADQLYRMLRPGAGRSPSRRSESGAPSACTSGRLPPCSAGVIRLGATSWSPRRPRFARGRGSGRTGRKPSSMNWAGPGDERARRGPSESAHPRRDPRRRLRRTGGRLGPDRLDDASRAVRGQRVRARLAARRQGRKRTRVASGRRRGPAHRGARSTHLVRVL